ncbi:LysR family transcriptional regulator [Caulobacter radicis]|uniref:LysR family transcriptional regulator n=1 Tax=Caulobacter radicis TaxID=2172650 RepID=UPI000D56C7D2|nr:LysR family transcriptional regulator [Caulobacter radicis]PVM84430.1 LysR family transcriptional regulator [Caulobacter radicis]
MDRLDAIELFAAAVEEGSLAAAARRHGRSPAAVTRAVALLEQHAGEALLLRSTRKLSLTAAGDRHLQIWREVIAKLGEIAPSSRTAALRGSIVLTAPELFGRLEVMPILETFLAEHPQISARALLLNREVNLVGEGVDLAVRLAPLADSSLAAVRIGEVGAFLCASPDYLARAGEPTGLGDLQHHECIGLNGEGDAELWSFGGEAERNGRPRSVRVRTRLSVNNAMASIDGALRGRGLIQARSYQVAGHIAAGRLVRLLRHCEPGPVPAHILFPADRAKNRAVRGLIDHLTPRLRRALQVVKASEPGSI